MRVFGSLGFGAVLVAGVVGVVWVGAVEDGDGALVLLVARVAVFVAVPAVASRGAAASPRGEPLEQEAVRVTARAAAVTAASGRMGAECRSP